MSSARIEDVQVSSGLTGVSGPSVSPVGTSSSVLRIVSDVRPSHTSATPAMPVVTSLPVFSSSVPSPTPLSDFPLLGSSRTGESFPLFHVLRSSSGLPLGQLNPFALCRSVACVLGIPFPDLSKLRDGCILVKTPIFAMSHAFSCVSSLVGLPGDPTGTPN